MAICSEENCNSKVMSRGWCSKHYYLLRDVPCCSVDGCQTKSQAKGMCQRHYSRLVRHGSPLAGGTDRNARTDWLLANIGRVDDSCFTWPYSFSGNGYPSRVRYMGELVSGHRAMCQMAHGEPESKNLVAAHSCGNGQKGCLNPKHLRWATSSENSYDAKAHGTHPGFQNRGSLSKLSKIKESDVVAIRRRVSSGETQSVVAKSFGLSPSWVSCICNKKSWAHV